MLLLLLYDTKSQLFVVSTGVGGIGRKFKINFNIPNKQSIRF